MTKDKMTPDKMLVEEMNKALQM